MGILIIDGNSVFEIDERCLKMKKIPRECDIEKYLLVETEGFPERNQDIQDTKISGRVNITK